MKKLAIIGGGAAGLTAGVSCADRLRLFGVPVQITIFERDDRVGRSILATGNGRCNFSNANIDALLYKNGDFVSRVLATLEEATGNDCAGCEDDAVHEFFRDLGLVWREESAGRQYPLANKASSVLDVLRAALAKRGVVEACERAVVLVDPPHNPGDHWALRMDDGSFEHVDAVIVACGGKLDSLQIAQWARPATRMVLGPIKTDTTFVRELNNIRVRARVSLFRAGNVVAAENGEVMFRKYGLSGIAVFNLSRFAQKGDSISIDFLSDACDEGRALDYLNARFTCLSQSGMGPVSYEDMLRGLLLPQVAHVVLKRCNVDASSACERHSIAQLARALSRFTVDVEGVAENENCQVHRGGYNVSVLDDKTMASREYEGLYLVGEALDVDAPCGGFNLHWAWASGMLAGISVADYLAGGSF